MSSPSSAKWGQAFLRQAEADLRAAEALVKDGSAASTACMVIQMVFEKLAKAYRLKNGESYSSVRQGSHRTMEKLIQTLQRQREIFRNDLGGPTDQRWKQLLGMLKALEDAQPSIAQDARPQLEYPWSQGGQVRWPEDHLALGKKLMDPRNRLAADLLRLGHTLVRNY